MLGELPAPGYQARNRGLLVAPAAQRGEDDACRKQACKYGETKHVVRCSDIVDFGNPQEHSSCCSPLQEGPELILDYPRFSVASMERVFSKPGVNSPPAANWLRGESAVRGRVCQLPIRLASLMFRHVCILLGA
jgi:hypothetical protein